MRRVEGGFLRASLLAECYSMRAYDYRIFLILRGFLYLAYTVYRILLRALLGKAERNRIFHEKNFDKVYTSLISVPYIFLYRLGLRGIIIRFSDFYAYCPTDSIDYNLHYTQERWIKELIPPLNGVVFDIGANVGRYTLRWAKTAKLLVAVEPQPTIFSRLNRNISLNHLSNVTSICRAAWHKDGELKQLYVRGTNPFFTHEGATLVQRPGLRISYPVETASIDTIASELGLDEIEFVKIDGEGVECEVLEGMQEILEERRVRYLLIEDHVWAAGDPTRILDKHGYRWRSLATIPTAKFILAWSPQHKSDHSRPHTATPSVTAT